MAGKSKSRKTSPIAEVEGTHRMPTMLSLEGANAKILKNKKIGQKFTMQVTGKVTRMEKGPFSPELGGSMEITRMSEGRKKKRSV